MGRKKIEINRQVIDAVLAMSDNRQETEDKICNLLSLETYHGANEAEREFIIQLYGFVLEREINMIELTLRHMRKNNYYV